MTKEDQVVSKYGIFLIGGISGCIAKTAIAPFDRVKIHFQLSSLHLRKYSGTVDFLINFIGPLKGIFFAIKDIYVTEGLYGLYKGHTATLLRIFPYAAINFSSYSILKNQIEYRNKTKFSMMPLMYRFVTGSLAGTHVAINLLKALHL
jgi:solute carrier family 25 protein 16